MKVFFDTEFTGLHKDTTLISIGCIDEIGNAFYAELNDYATSQCNEWIKDNVLAHLNWKGRHDSERIYLNNNGDVTMIGDKQFVAEKFSEWLAKYDSVQFVSDVCHYDMVLLIDLFGTAFDLPNYVSPVCHDICQDIATHYGLTDFGAFDASREGLLTEPIEGSKHNALYDAMVIRQICKQMQK